MTGIDKFKNSVYDIVKSIPYGKVLTYGQIAWLAGQPTYSRLVGRTLWGTKENLPCHRVVNSQGRTAPDWEEQIELLKAEGVRFKRNGYVDLKSSNWDLSTNTDTDTKQTET